MTPASTIKIATTTAALSVLGPDHRIATTAALSPDSRTLTLVGGGDPTLAKADLRAMAAEAAHALREDGEDGEDPAGPVRLTYDVSRYTGPELHPISPNENIAPVTALMIDEGRLDGSDRGPADRTDDPAGDAARAFAEALEKAGVQVTGAPREARAADEARTVATHRSAPLSALAERTLTNSDNDIAEALARQTAIAKGEKASFAGARRAVTNELKKLQLPVGGAHFADGSGLDRKDRVTPALPHRPPRPRRRPRPPRTAPRPHRPPDRRIQRHPGRPLRTRRRGHRPRPRQDRHPPGRQLPRRNRRRPAGPPARLRLPRLRLHLGRRGRTRPRRPGHRPHGRLSGLRTRRAAQDPHHRATGSRTVDA